MATVFRRKDLFGALPLVGDDNRQREYYLNDVFPILLDKGERVSAISVDTGGVMGLNSRGGLAAVTRVVRERINAAHMANGVTLLDPATTYIDVGVRIGADTTIGPGTTIEGDTTIGRNGRIGPSVQIRDATIGDGATIRFAVVEEARLARNVTVGPFARIRPGTQACRQRDRGLLRRGEELATSAPTRRCPICPTSATRRSASARTSAPPTSPPTGTATASIAP